MAAHRRMLAPINSNKHYVHRTNAVITGGVVDSIVAVDATSAPASTNPFDVEEGSIVKAIHFEYWLLSNGATGSDVQFIVIVEKVPSNQASVTAAQIVNLGAYPNKKNILFTSHGVLGAAVDGQGSLPVLNSWILIPKGKQRQGLGDRIVTTFLPIGENVNICGLATYKEFR